MRKDVTAKQIDPVVAQVLLGIDGSKITANHANKEFALSRYKETVVPPLAHCFSLFGRSNTGDTVVTTLFEGEETFDRLASSQELIDQRGMPSCKLFNGNDINPNVPAPIVIPTFQRRY